MLCSLAAYGAYSNFHITDSVGNNVFIVDENAKKKNDNKINKDELINQLNKKVDESMINISMNLNPIFKDGKSDGLLMIVNEEINNYPQVIEIFRQDTNQLIYKSKGIPVGSLIESAKLDINLAKGDYDCIAYFNAINENTGDIIGKAGAKIKISILN